MTVVSVQAFGISAPGGGPRILRALFERPEARVVNVCTMTSEPPPADPFEELWIPARPAFGPLERTRAGAPLSTLETALARRLERQIAATCERHRAAAVHTVAHRCDFWPASQAARRLGLPFMLTVHDDLRYVMRGRPDCGLAQRRLGQAWREASHRFAVSERLGEEYGIRFGARDYTIVTDGLRDDQIAARSTRPGGLRVYFAGLFHRAYTDNVRQFAAGLAQLGSQRGLTPSLTLRCGTLPVELDAAALGATVLPFGSEDSVGKDLESADLAYMPLPFGRAYRDFFRFSLSTKMVTYLGTGRPIVYHGPAEGAAYDILSQNDAAVFVHDLEPAAIARALAAGFDRSAEIAANALELASAQFRVGDQRERFWSAFPAAATGAATLVA